MRKTIVALASVGLLSLSSAAMAAEGDFAEVDANSDGQVSLEEGKTIHTDWTAEAYAELDTDGNGSLSEDEYEAAMMKKEMKTDN